MKIKKTKILLPILLCAVMIISAVVVFGIGTGAPEEPHVARAAAYDWIEGGAPSAIDETTPAEMPTLLDIFIDYNSAAADAKFYSAICRYYVPVEGSTSEFTTRYFYVSRDKTTVANVITDIDTLRLNTETNIYNRATLTFGGNHRVTLPNETTATEGFFKVSTNDTIKLTNTTRTADQIYSLTIRGRVSGSNNLFEIGAYKSKSVDCILENMSDGETAKESLFVQNYSSLNRAFDVLGTSQTDKSKLTIEQGVKIISIGTAVRQRNSAVVMNGGIIETTSANDTSAVGTYTNGYFDFVLKGGSVIGSKKAKPAIDAENNGKIYLVGGALDNGSGRAIYALSGSIYVSGTPQITGKLPISINDGGFSYDGTDYGPYTGTGPIALHIGTQSEKLLVKYSKGADGNYVDNISKYSVPEMLLYEKANKETSTTNESGETITVLELWLQKKTPEPVFTGEFTVSENASGGYDLSAVTGGDPVVLTGIQSFADIRLEIDGIVNNAAEGMPITINFINSDGSAVDFSEIITFTTRTGNNHTNYKYFNYTISGKLNFTGDNYINFPAYENCTLTLDNAEISAVKAPLKFSGKAKLVVDNSTVTALNGDYVTRWYENNSTDWISGITVKGNSSIKKILVEAGTVITDAGYTGAGTIAVNGISAAADTTLVTGAAAPQQVKPDITKWLLDYKGKADYSYYKAVKSADENRLVLSAKLTKLLDYEYVENYNTSTQRSQFTVTGKRTDGTIEDSYTLYYFASANNSGSLPDTSNRAFEVIRREIQAVKAEAGESFNTVPKIYIHGNRGQKVDGTQYNDLAYASFGNKNNGSLEGAEISGRIGNGRTDQAQTSITLTGESLVFTDAAEGRLSTIVAVNTIALTNVNVTVRGGKITSSITLNEGTGTLATVLTVEDAPEIKGNIILKSKDSTKAQIFDKGYTGTGVITVQPSYTGGAAAGDALVYKHSTYPAALTDWENRWSPLAAGFLLVNNTEHTQLILAAATKIYEYEFICTEVTGTNGIWTGKPYYTYSVIGKYEGGYTYNVLNASSTTGVFSTMWDTLDNDRKNADNTYNDATVTFKNATYPDLPFIAMVGQPGGTVAGRAVYGNVTLRGSFLSKGQFTPTSGSTTSDGVFSLQNNSTLTIAEGAVIEQENISSADGKTGLSYVVRVSRKNNVWITATLNVSGTIKGGADYAIELNSYNAAVNILSGGRVENSKGTISGGECDAGGAIWLREGTLNLHSGATLTSQSNTKPTLMHQKTTEQLIKVDFVVDGGSTLPTVIENTSSSADSTAFWLNYNFGGAAYSLTMPSNVKIKADAGTALYIEKVADGSTARTLSLTVDGAEITSQTGFAVKADGDYAAKAVRTIIVNEGSVISTGGSGTAVFLGNAYKAGVGDTVQQSTVLNVTGGTISAVNGKAIEALGAVKVAISGGTISATGTGTAVYIDAHPSVTDATKPDINVTGGTVSAATGAAIRILKGKAALGGTETSFGTATSGGEAAIHADSDTSVDIGGYAKVENTAENGLALKADGNANAKIFGNADIGKINYTVTDGQSGRLYLYGTPKIAEITSNAAMIGQYVGTYYSGNAVTVIWTGALKDGEDVVTSTNNKDLWSVNGYFGANLVNLATTLSGTAVKLAVSESYDYKVRKDGSYYIIETRLISGGVEIGWQELAKIGTSQYTQLHNALSRKQSGESGVIDAQVKSIEFISMNSSNVNVGVYLGDTPWQVTFGTFTLKGVLRGASQFGVISFVNSGLNDPPKVTIEAEIKNTSTAGGYAFSISMPNSNNAPQVILGSQTTLTGAVSISIKEGLVNWKNVTYLYDSGYSGSQIGINISFPQGMSDADRKGYAVVKATAENTAGITADKYALTPNMPEAYSLYKAASTAPDPDVIKLHIKEKAYVYAIGKTSDGYVVHGYYKQVTGAPEDAPYQLKAAGSENTALSAAEVTAAIDNDRAGTSNPCYIFFCNASFDAENNPIIPEIPQARPDAVTNLGADSFDFAQKVFYLICSNITSSATEYVFRAKAFWENGEVMSGGSLNLIDCKIVTSTAATVFSLKNLSALRMNIHGDSFINTTCEIINNAGSIVVADTAQNKEDGIAIEINKATLTAKTDAIVITDVNVEIYLAYTTVSSSAGKGINYKGYGYIGIDNTSITAEDNAIFSCGAAITVVGEVTESGETVMSELTSRTTHAVQLETSLFDTVVSGIMNYSGQIFVGPFTTFGIPEDTASNKYYHIYDNNTSLEGYYYYNDDYGTLNYAIEIYSLQMTALKIYTSFAVCVDRAAYKQADSPGYIDLTLPESRMTVTAPDGSSALSDVPVLYILREDSDITGALEDALNTARRVYITGDNDYVCMLTSDFADTNNINTAVLMHNFCYLMHNVTPDTNPEFTGVACDEIDFDALYDAGLRLELEWFVTKKRANESIVRGDTTLKAHYSDVPTNPKYMVFGANEYRLFYGDLIEGSLIPPPNLMLAIAVSKADYADTVTFEDGSFVYDKTKKVILISGTFEGRDQIPVTVTYSCEGSQYDVGTATVTATFATESGNYNVPAPKTAKIIITPKQINVTWSGLTVDYTGSVQKPAAAINEGQIIDGDIVNLVITIYQGEAALEGGALNAGSYTVKLTADNANYKVADGQDEKTFIINKIDPTVYPVYAEITGGTLWTTDSLPVISLGEGSTSGSIGWDSGYVISEGSKTYYWTFTPADGTNYNEFKGNKDYTAQRNAVTSITIGGTYKTDYTALEVFDKSGMTITAETANGNNVTIETERVQVVYAGEDGKLHFGDTAVTISYTDGVDTVTATVTVTVQKATFDMSGIEFLAVSAAYNGNEHTAVISGDLPTGITVGYLNNKRTDAGSQTATAKFTVNNDYNAIGDLTADISIAKAPFGQDPAYTALAASYAATYGDTLADITTLPTGWSFNDAATTSVGNAATTGNSFAATYMPSSENYEGTTDTVVIIVAKAAATQDPAYNALASSYAATYGDTLADIATLPTGWSFNDAVTTSVGNANTTGNSFAATYTPSDTNNYNGTTDTVSIIVARADITGITFVNASFIYDSTERTITITGTLPEGVTVSYNNNTRTNAGVQTATATFDVGNNYNTIDPMTAELAIEKATVTGIAFANASFNYDGQEHSITITGTLPEGVTVAYQNNARTFGGTQTATAIFTVNDNYNDIAQMIASITIVTTLTTAEEGIDLSNYKLGDNLPVPPARKGYEFGGWYTNPDFDGEKVEKIEALDTNIVLYAKWVKKGLTGGAIAGIVIGSLVGAAALACALWLIIKKKKPTA